MAPGRRKQTREELEEAILENERVNGAPEGPEEPRAKKLRLGRLASKRSRLKKQLRALEARELDPNAGTTGPLNQTSQSGAERMRIHRGRLSQEARAVERGRNTTQRQEARAQLTADERAVERERNTLLQQELCAQLTQEERAVRREANTQLQQELRAQLTQEAREAQREQDRLRIATERLAREEEVAEARKEAVRIRRKCVRRGHAFCSHETLDKSRVSGKNVSDGRHVLPDMFECIGCGARKWPGESDVSCCLKGKVKLPPLKRVPEYLLQYYSDPEFRKYIRAYNQVFAFTSTRVARSDGAGVRPVQEDRTVQGQHDVYTYKIQGAMGHYLRSLLPQMEYNGDDLAPAKFAQIYIVDEDLRQRVLRRKSIFAELDTEKLTTLETMMQAFNPFAQQFLSHGEKYRQDREDGAVSENVVYNLHADKRRSDTTNLPTLNEVGAVMVEDGNFNKHRDLLLYTKRRGLLRIFETNPMYYPLQYPLLFPHGELGWTFTEKYADGQKYCGKEEMYLREHVAYRLFLKHGDNLALHQGGRLFQQWCVDQRAKVEQDALRWISNNQATLRADLYSGVQDAYLTETPGVLGEGEGRFSEYNRETRELQHPDTNGGRRQHFLDRIGKRIILPATYTGGPRQMYKSYQDSMAIVREFGKPDIFLTMTCNRSGTRYLVNYRKARQLKTAPTL